MTPFGNVVILFIKKHVLLCPLEKQFMTYGKRQYCLCVTCSVIILRAGVETLSLRKQIKKIFFKLLSQVPCRKSEKFSAICCSELFCNELYSFFNGFTEISIISHRIHPLKVYTPVVGAEPHPRCSTIQCSSIITVMCTSSPRWGTGQHWLYTKKVGASWLS